MVCSHLGACVAQLGLSWGASWAILGRLRTILGHVGAIWSILGGVLGHLGPSSGHLGATLGRLGVIMGRLGAILGVVWGACCSSGGLPPALEGSNKNRKMRGVRVLAV